LIFAADVLSAGDAVNRAPTVTPTVTSTATATATGTRTPDAATPVSPPVAPPPTIDVGVDLTGIGAELQLVHSYAGAAPARVTIDTTTRVEVEREIRVFESGSISDCAPDRFAARYVPGRRYLVFANEVTPGDNETLALFPIEGDNIVLHDPLLATSLLGELYMTQGTYDRYFSTVERYDAGYGIAAPTVPLATVLRAIAGLRGEPSVAPPDTGSGGMAALRTD
jgi:hypothetical protein